MKRARKPRRDVAHPIPRASYTIEITISTDVCVFIILVNLLCTANNGNTALNVYLDTPFAAIADAPFCGPYTSTRYNAAEVYKSYLISFKNHAEVTRRLTNKHKFPQANGTVPANATAQCSPLSAAHPSQNNPTTIPLLPIIALYSLCSGATCVLPSATALRWTFWYMILSTRMQVVTPSKTPTPTEMNASPDWEVVKE